MENPDSVKLIHKLENELAKTFVGRDEEARVAILALLTKQHAVFIGEPGTAKSALIRRLSQLVNARFFYYLLSKYTVPDELIGAIDPIAYKQGKFVRNIQGKLPTSELAFIDEVFRGSSETLNTLLNIMNERIFVDADGTVYNVPLHSLFGASNEPPSDSELVAFYDRFLLKHFVKRIPSDKLEEAIVHNLNLKLNTKPIIDLNKINKIYDEITEFMIQNATIISKIVSQLVILFRQHGIFVSDRTAVSPYHLPRLVATYSYVYGVDFRKAVITVSKYILPTIDMLENYKKALNSLIPSELRQAQERLETAANYAASGDLANAKRYTTEAIQLIQNLMAEQTKFQMYADEIRELIFSAEKLLKEITEIEERLKRYKKS